jgi:hypothetical protein
MSGVARSRALKSSGLLTTPDVVMNERRPMFKSIGHHSTFAMPWPVHFWIWRYYASSVGLWYYREGCLIIAPPCDPLSPIRIIVRHGYLSYSSLLWHGVIPLHHGEQ